MGLFKLPLRIAAAIGVAFSLSMMAVEAKHRHQDIFIVEVLTVAGTSSYKPFDGDNPAKFRVIDVWAYSALAGAADTVKVTDGTTDITDALDMSGDKDVKRATTIDDSVNEIAFDGTLEVVTASGAVCRVFILCVNTD